jgi:hypothetical protein
MTTVIKRVIEAAVLGAMMLGAAGCIHDEIDPVGPNDGPAKGVAKVEFTLDFPSEVSAATRVVADDEAINDLNVLVFDASLLFVERIEVPIADVDLTGDFKSFTIDFEPADEDTSYGFLVYANSDAELDALPAAYYATEEPKNTDDFFAALKFAIPDDGLAYLPMYGATETAVTVTSTTKIPTIQMTRGVARVDIEISNDIADQLRFGAGGIVAPYSYALNMIMNGNYNPSSRDVSTFAVDNSNLRTDPLEYATTEGASSASPLYVGEYDNSAAENEFCFVINADYGEAGTADNGWYKVVLRDKDDNKIDLLRNHRYVITITEVSGPGADTWEEALEGLESAYIQVIVTPWNEAEQNVIFDGIHYLEVSESAFTIYREAGSTVITAKTNYIDPSGVQGPFGNGVKYTLDVGEVAGIIANGVHSSPSAGVDQLAVTLTWGASTEEYDATLTFTAGNMSYVVKIHHSPDSWMTFTTDPYYLLDGKFHEFGVTANDEWSFDESATAFVSGDNVTSYFEAVNTSSAEIADKLMFSTTARDPENDEVGTIRLTFHNDKRNYVDKTVDIKLVSRVPVPGIRAVKDVIGYYANGDKKGQLTLVGDDGDDEDIVYVAYFKYGSLIATKSEDRGNFTSSDIVAVPSTDSGFPYTLAAYKATITGSGPGAWDMINEASDAEGITLSTGSNITQLLGDDYVEDGLGDPCVQYFTGYRLPTAVENVRFVGGVATGTTDQTYWQTWAPGNTNFFYHDTQYGVASSTYGIFDFWNYNAGTVEEPGEGSFPVVANETDYPGVAAFSTVLPAAGQRTAYGSLTGQGSMGSYMSSTTSNGYSSYLYSLHFDYSTAYPVYSSTATMGRGYAVRCVQPAPTISVTPEEYTFAPAGGTKNDFAVATTNFSGTPSVTKTGDSSDISAAWITDASLSGDGTTLTVTTTANYTYAVRSATVTLIVTNATGTDTAEVTITQDTYTGGENHVLYYTGDARYPLKVGRWDTSLTAEDEALGVIRLTEADRSKVALFKFGSVIGVSSSGGPDGDTWDNAYIKFNPSNLIVGQDILYYKDHENDTKVPAIPCFDEDDFNTGYRNVSDSAYHNATNIANNGKGDPCKLAGMDMTRKNEAGYLANYDSGWRLPTLQENRMFVGVTHWNFNGGYDTEDTAIYKISPTTEWTLSNPGTGIFPSNGAREEDPRLPAVGHVGSSLFGTTYGVGVDAYYWTSTAERIDDYYPDPEVAAWSLEFHYDRLSTDALHGSESGNAVRCIRDE